MTGRLMYGQRILLSQGMMTMTEELDSANMEKKPYVNYTLDEDREDTNSTTLNIRLNLEEQERIDQLKFIYRYDQDAKIIKLALKVLQNVTLGTFGGQTMYKVTDERRKRAIARYKFEGENIVKL